MMLGVRRSYSTLGQVSGGEGERNGCNTKRAQRETEKQEYIVNTENVSYRMSQKGESWWRLWLSTSKSRGRSEHSYLISLLPSLV